MDTHLRRCLQTVKMNLEHIPWEELRELSDKASIVCAQVRYEEEKAAALKTVEKRRGRWFSFLEGQVLNPEFIIDHWWIPRKLEEGRELMVEIERLCDIWTKNVPGMMGMSYASTFMQHDQEKNEKCPMCARILRLRPEFKDPS